MTETQTDQHEDFRRQVLKVAVFNIFINVVEDRMHRKADKFVSSSVSYQNAKS